MKFLQSLKMFKRSNVGQIGSLLRKKLFLTVLELFKVFRCYYFCYCRMKNQYKCLRCLATFGRKQDLTRHKRAHKKNTEYFLLCSICGKRITRKNKKRHERRCMLYQTKLNIDGPDRDKEKQNYRNKHKIIAKQTTHLKKKKK